MATPSKKIKSNPSVSSTVKATITGITQDYTVNGIPNYSSINTIVNGTPTLYLISDEVLKGFILSNIKLFSGFLGVTVTYLNANLISTFSSKFKGTMNVNLVVDNPQNYNSPEIISIAPDFGADASKETITRIAHPIFTPVQVPFFVSDLSIKEELRLGYAIFPSSSPIISVEHNNGSYYKRKYMLRTSGSTKKGTGDVFESYTLSIQVDRKDIPTSLLPFIKQVSLTPFITVEGGCFGSRNGGGIENDIRHNEIAVRNITLSTLPGFPNNIRLDIDFEPFIYSHYVHPAYDSKAVGYDSRLSLDDGICWPLFKIWSELKAFPSYSKEKEIQGFDGSFKCSLPNLSFLDALPDLLIKNDLLSTAQKDLSTLNTLLNGFILANPDAIESDTVREIYPRNDSLNVNANLRYYAVKIESKDVFNKLAGGAFSGVTVSTPPQLIGLIDWKKVEPFSYFSEDKGLKSIVVSSTQLEKTFSIESAILSNKNQKWTDPLQICDIAVPGVNSAPDFATQLTSFFNTAVGTHNIPVLVPQNLPTLVKDALNNPQNYFAVVLAVSNTDTKFQSSIKAITNNLSNKQSSPIATTNLNQVIKKKWNDVAKEGGNEYVYPLDFVSSNGKILVEQVSATRGHNLSLMNSLNSVLPIHQYMGGLDAVVVVKGKCFGLEGKKILDELKLEIDTRNKNRTTKKYLSDREDKRLESRFNSFLRVENEIFQLIGIDFAVPLTYNIKNVQGQPDVWDFTITFVDMNFKGILVERVRYLQTFSESMNKTLNIANQDESNTMSPFVQKALDWYSLQKKLRSEEVFPDMNLPTIGELDSWIRICSKVAKIYVGLGNKNLSSADIASSVLSSTKLSPDEKVIANIIMPFLTTWGNTATDMADSKKWSSSNGATSYTTFNNTMYCDPDFYYYYYDGERDKVTGRVNPLAASQQEHDLADHGALKKDGTSVGPDANNPIAPTNIMLDLTHNTGTITDNSFFNGQNSRLDKTKAVDPASGQTFMLDSGKPSSEDPEYMEKIAQLTKNTMTFLSKADQWTDPLSGTISGDNITKSIDPNYLSNALSGDPVNVLGTDPSVLVSSPYDITYRKQFILNTVNNHPPSINNGDPNYSTKGNFWYSQDNIGTEQWLSNETTQALTPHKVANPNDMIDLLPLVSTTQRITYINEIYFNVYFLHPVKTRNTFIDSVIGGDNVSTLLHVRNYVMQSASYQFGDDADEFDPNIVISYLLTESGFGAYSSPQNTLTKFGAVNKEIFNVVGGTDEPSPSTVIDKIVKVYFDAVTKYRIPTAALLATVYYLKTAVELPQNLQSYLLNNVNLYLSKVGNVDEAEQAINTIVHKFNNILPDTAVVDRYWSNYLQISKNFGSYVICYDSMPKDLFFDPLHPIILQDDTSPSDKTLILNTDHSPSGKGVDINFSPKPGNITGDSPNSNDVIDHNQSAYQKEKDMLKYDLLLKPTSEAVSKGAIEDLLKHSHHGRLSQAFPAYQVLIINEGFYWQGGTKKLWDQFYTRTGVTEIEVFRSRISPTHSCRIEFSNTFFTLTSYPLIEALSQELALYEKDRMKPSLDAAKSIGTELLNNFLVKDVPEDVLRIWKNNHLKQLALTPGARLQVRMGYGSDASAIPVTFNGVITQTQLSEGAMEIYAAGDGIELEKQLTHKMVNSRDGYAFRDGGILGQGKDPSTLVTDSLVSCSLFDNLAFGNFRDLSKGVAHFGDVYYGSDNIFHPTEIMQNIYASTPGKLEQAIPAWRNWLNVNAIYNWNGSVGISVDVQEPTPWKVIQTCRLAVTDFVASVEPFASRSTLFFGKWWWPFYYDYADSMFELAQPNVKVKRDVVIPTVKYLTSQRRSEQDIVGLNALAEPGILESMTQYVKTSGVEDNLYIIPEMFPNTPVEQLAPYAVPGDFGTAYKDVIVKVRKADDSILNLEWWILERGDGRYFVFANKLVPNTSYEMEQSPEISLSRPTGTKLQFDERYSNPFAVSQGVAAIRVDTLLSEDNLLYSKVFKSSSFDSSPAARYDAFDVSNLETGDKVYAYDFLKDTNDFVAHLKWKPFTQFYFAHSYLNLLDNQVALTSNKLATDAILEHTSHGLFGSESVGRTMSFAVDSNISPSERRTMLVKSSLMLTAIQGGIEQQFLGWIPLIGENIKGKPTTPAIHNSVIAALADNVRNMYDGEFVIMGTATIKPYDVVDLTDHKNNLKGPVFVREVVHSMSVERGFTTTITPDVIALPKHSMVGLEWLQGILINTLHRTTSYYVWKTINHYTIGAFTRYLRHQAGINRAYGGADLYDEIWKLHMDNNLELDKFSWYEDFIKVDNEMIDEALQIRWAVLEGDTVKLGNIILTDNPGISATDMYKRITTKLKSDFIKKNGVASSITKEFGNEVAKNLSTGVAKALEVNAVTDEVLLKSILSHKIQPFSVKNVASNVYSAAKKTAKVIKDSYVDASSAKTREERIKDVIDFGTSKHRAFKAQIEVGVADFKEVAAAAKAAGSSDEALKVVLESKRVGELINSIKNAFAAGETLGTFAAPEFAIIMDAAKIVVMQETVDYINEWLDSAHSVIIMPLMAGDIPFVCGIRGHQGAVINDDPSWTDILLRDLIDPSVTPLWSPWKLASVPLNFIGVNMPNNWTNSADKNLVDGLKQYYSDTENKIDVNKQK